MLEFKNSELVVYGNFLAGLNLKNKASRARTKLVTKLSDKLEEFNTDHNDLIEKYGQHDNEGNLIRDEADSIKLEENLTEEATQAFLELDNEIVRIDIEEYLPNIKFLTLALDELDTDFSNNDAAIYDSLMDKLEENK